MVSSKGNLGIRFTKVLLVYLLFQALSKTQDHGESGVHQIPYNPLLIHLSARHFGPTGMYACISGP